MATRIEEILGRDINSLKELREEIKRLQDSIANVDPTTQQFKDTTEKLAAAQEQLTSVTRGSKDGIDAAKDSIVGMEREYKNLYNTYKMLTEEQRNSDFGKNMADSLNTLSTKLNDTKKGVGNFKDNIGRYTDSIIDAFKQMGISLGGLSTPLKLASNGIKGLNTALKANPIMAIVGAIQLMITVVNKMKGAIQQNEELQMRWNEAMSAFRPIIDAISRGVQRLAEDFVKLAEGVANVIRWFRNLTKTGRETNKLYQDIAKSQNQLTLNKREYQKLNAEDEAEVQRLREEASETSNVEERKRLLTEAKEKQAEIDNRNIELAKENLRILEEQAQLTANDAAMNDKLAAAVAAVSQAEATAANNMRAFNKQLGLSTSGAGGAGAAMKSLKEQAKELYEQLVEDSKTEVQKLTEKYEKERKLLEKYGLDTTLLTKKYNKEVSEARKKEVEEMYAKYAEMHEWAMQEYRINAMALGQTEAELTRQMLDVDVEYFDAMKVGIGIILKDTNLTIEEQLQRMQEIVQEANANGLDLQFPPEGFELATEDGIERILRYIDNYGIELKKRVKKTKEEIEDVLADERLTKKAQESLSLMMDDELEAMLKGVGGPELEALIQANTRASLEAQKAALEEELNAFKGTQEKKLELMQEYYDVVAQMRQADYEAQVLNQERNDEIMDAAFDRYMDIGDAITTVTNAVNNLIQAQINDANITEEQAKKKKKTLIALEKVALAVNIAQIAASTAAGIMDVWKGYATETAANAVAAAATGPAAPATLAALNTKSLASAILKTTGLATMGAANIAAATMGTISKVQSIKGSEGGGSAEVSPVANIAEIDSTPYSYTRTVQTAEEYDATYNKEYFVSVTDINSVQNRVKVRENESSF